MATKCYIPSILLGVLLIVLTSFLPHLAHSTKPPVVFILGDSTADVGTNNFLAQSNATANFPHNGVDYPNSTPTGRFSNGFNSADFLAQLFGLKKSPPPFLFLLTLKSKGFKRQLFQGVNFASGGSGLLDITGANLTVVALSEQITQFTSVRNNFTAIIGRAATKKLLCKSLFFISIGSNDIFEYFKSQSKVPEDEFISNLISTYAQHITTLYGLGARKFGIISVPAVGCCPAQRLVQKQIHGNYDCFEEMNGFALAFYKSLGNLLVNISSELPGIKYSLGNAFNMTIDVINNGQFFDFKNVDSACCGTGALNATGPCNRNASLCSNREEFLFWDMFHPTQKAANLSAQTLYGGPSYYVSPINFSQLPEDD